jgi:hypothetical protein
VDQGRKIAGYGDTTEVLRVPVGPFVYFMALMVAVTGIVHLTKVIFPAPPAARAVRSRQADHHMTEALVGLGLMMVLALLRIPIAVAMGWSASSASPICATGTSPRRSRWWRPRVYETGRNYTLSVVPLFILMGNFVTRAGMSQELFRAAYTCIGHLRGGLAMATVCACAGFGAICGSSIATAATMAKVAYPAMSELGYSTACRPARSPAEARSAFSFRPRPSW